MARSLPGFAAFLILGLTGNVGGQAIPVGVARVDITPTGPIRLCGYEGRKAESKGVQQTLWAKALAIGDDAAGPALLVTVDNLGVPETVTRAVAARLKTGAGILPERLAVASSHTHSAPCLTGVAPNIFAEPIPADHQARIDAYTSGLIDKLERVCRDALRDRKPATLAWAQGTVGFALNRRTKGGPVDHALPVLRVADPSGHVRAILVNYACHCTTLDPRDNLISGDWAGDAQEAVEAAYPGAIALVAIGCGADANPEGRVSREAALRHGKAVAVEVSRLLGGTMTPLNGLPRCRVERVSLPFDTLPTREALNALVAKGGAPGYNARTQLARLDRGESLQGALDYSVQTWQFGDDLMMVFLPGEVVVDYVLRLKKELDPSRLWVTAYANDEPCYIPSERILKEGGYEGGGAMAYYARPTKLKAGVENLIVEAVRKIVPPAFEAGAARKGP